MAVDIISRLHDLADKFGRRSGAYLPEVETINDAIKEINKARREDKDGRH